MKRILLAMALLIAVPFTFTSCGDKDDNVLKDLTGKMEMVINGTSHSYIGCGSYQKDGKTYIATMDGEGTVAIQLSGTKSGTYTLGLTNVTDISSITGLITGGLNFGKFENVMTFIPFSNSQDKYIVVAGECQFTNSGTYVKGTFKGKAIKYEDISNLDVASVIKLITNGTTISGSFKAVEASSIADLF